jgi:hypothetical protein
MRPVRVNKSELLDKLQHNRELHHGIFLEALEGYRKEALRLFGENLDKIKKGKPFLSYVSLTTPVDHTADYDAAIGLLNFSIDDSVDLDEESYRSFVLDEWAWKKQFLSTNSYYSNTAAVAAASVNFD